MPQHALPILPSDESQEGYRHPSTRGEVGNQAHSTIHQKRPGHKGPQGGTTGAQSGAWDG
ncbi:hypothetical protein T484DRAFT_1973833 [Baffinella frigidus]|nr:hypothetical protein T484DRAFT_1973833 [Cryptophyta sp. CCMP2293]